jgi:LPPG:FO 2-phospho-L-lactate transferase
VNVCLCCGGFGGARFAPGLVDALGPEAVTVLTNPGDDLRFDGLELWPDFDSTLYGLAGRFDEALGWGRLGDSFHAADALGEAGWFRIGDHDRSLSILRTAWLADGIDRAEVARRCAERLGVTVTIVPAAAEPHRTVVDTASGSLPLQEWLVRRRAADPPLGVRRSPVASAATAPALAALRDADLVVLGPSNPIISLMPILTTPGIADALAGAPRVVAVSPTVSAVAPRTAPEQGRYDVRGRLLELFGLPHTAAALPALWPGLLHGIVVDHRDEGVAREIEDSHGLPVLRTDLLRFTPFGRTALAREVIAFGAGLRARTETRTAAGAA